MSNAVMALRLEPASTMTTSRERPLKRRALTPLLQVKRSLFTRGRKWLEHAPALGLGPGMRFGPLAWKTFGPEAWAPEYGGYLVMSKLRRWGRCWATSLKELSVSP